MASASCGTKCPWKSAQWAGLSRYGSIPGNGLRTCRMRLYAAGDRGHDADLVAGLHRRFQVLQEADVLVVQVDVHEPVELVLAFEQPRLDAGGAGLEAVEDLADAAAVGLDDVGAVGVVAQRGGDADSHAHGCSLSVCG